ncbi:MAG TPA: DUF898 family protein, partial [Bryobacteraceae bacterium]|nr:DUF898 family protein [Bryobacteraceae bacterium]
YGEMNGFAEQLYRRIVDIQRSAHTEKSEAYYGALMDLASCLHSRKRLGEAQETYERALAVRQAMGKNDDKAAICLEGLARCRMARHLYQEAVESAEAAIQLRKRLGKDTAASELPLEALLAEAYLHMHDSKKSDAYFLQMYSHLKPEWRYTFIQTGEELCKIYEEQGDYQQAAAKLELVVGVIESANAADARLPPQEAHLAQLYQRAGRLDDANRMNMAAIRAMGRTVKATGDPQRIKYVLIAFFVIFVGLPIGGTAISAPLFAWSARKMDRRLALKYLPEPPPLPQEQLSRSETSDALVGGFLGLDASPMVATEAVVEAVEEPPVVPAVIQEPESSQVTLNADGSDLFAMRVLNLLFALLTLGIYSFWGKARVRRYVCGQAEFQGDWFAFHGTGRELFLGWLRALPALAFIFLFPTLLPLLWQHRWSPYVGQLSAVLAFLLLWPIARVGAYRYRLNRMSWRAIRFSYRGKALRYLGESVLNWLICLITLGLYVPFLQVRLRKLLFNQTFFGDREFQFSGRASELFPAWLFALPLTVCSFGIGWAWWRAFTHRYCWANTTIAGGRFRCTATGAKLFWLWVGNFFVIVFTLGLGMSWAMLRTLRFWTRHIQLVGDAEFSKVEQDRRATSALGESFADFLGFDFGF